MSIVSNIVKPIVSSIVKPIVSVSIIRDLWVDPITAGPGWVDNGDGSYTHSGTLSSELFHSSAGLTEDQSYTCKVTVTGLQLDTFQLGGPPTLGNNKQINLAAGTHEFVLSAESVSINDSIRLFTNKDGCTVSAISVVPL